MKADGDLTIIYSTFHYYETKSPIEVDATFTRSTDNILKSLKHPQPSFDEKYNVNFRLKIQC